MEEYVNENVIGDIEVVECSVFKVAVGDSIQIQHMIGDTPTYPINIKIILNGFNQDMKACFSITTEARFSIKGLDSIGYNEKLFLTRYAYGKTLLRLNERVVSETGVYIPLNFPPDEELLPKEGFDIDK